MTSAERMAVMRERLSAAFSPEKLQIIDDSDQHRGHVGSQGGAGHYTVVLSGQHFTNKSRVEAHREIYALFDDLIPDEVHALQIKIS